MTPATLDMPETLAKPLEAVNQTAKRAIKSVRHGLEQLEDLKDEAAHQVKRQPLMAIGIAAGTGLLVGVAIGWIGGRFARR